MLQRIAFCLLLVCAGTLPMNASPYHSIELDTTMINTLSQQEIKSGWILLFDGKTMKNWQTFRNIPGSWFIKDGMLCSEKPTTSQHPDLMTIEEFDNFELSVDWKLSPQGNSGIMYLVTEATGASFESGPEYQLIDDDNFPHPITDKQKSGAVYDMYPPKVKATNPPGAWNTTLIKVNKGKVEHWLNGKLVASYTLWTDDWRKQKANSKWKDVAAYGVSNSGHIAFQASHSEEAGTGVYFRNIKIRKL